MHLNWHYIIFALGAVMVVSLYMAVAALMRKDPVRERLKRVLPVAEIPAEPGTFEAPHSGLFLFCNNLLAACGIDLAAARREFALPMLRAGITSPDALAYLLFFKWFVQPVLVASGVLAITYAAFGPDMPLSEQLQYLIAAGILLTLGFDGTRTYLAGRIERRKEVLQESFPDALDLMLICVEAGLPLDAALARVCRELKTAHPEITQELDRTRIEISMLNDRERALHNLAERTDIQGFKVLVGALIQTEKIGSSMAETLRVLAGEYRAVRMVTAEGKAARIPALITVPLVFFIMPAFMIIIMGPLAIHIIQQGGFFPEPYLSRPVR